MSPKRQIFFHGAYRYGFCSLYLIRFTPLVVERSHKRVEGANRDEVGRDDLHLGPTDRSAATARSSQELAWRPARCRPPLAGAVSSGCGTRGQMEYRQQ